MRISPVDNGKHFNLIINIMKQNTQITSTDTDSLMAILRTIRTDFLMLEDGSWDGSSGIQHSLNKLDQGIRIVNNYRPRNFARIGTYDNGHDLFLIDQLNRVLEKVRDEDIIEELFVNYFDDQDIKGIIEFFEGRLVIKEKINKKK